MVDAQRRPPANDGVARLASVSAGDVRDIFACRAHAIVATAAVAGNAVVIEIRRAPGGRGMAALAVVIRRDVGCGFATRYRAVMAGETGT